jgi:polyhydroxyalkanoate synthase
LKNILLSGSADEVGKEIKKSLDRMLDTTKKWSEILQFDPDPQTGLSPKDIVWRKNKSKLYRYVSPHGYKHRTPILMVYALINKAYMLDLTPGMSMVEHLIESGFDVYLLDWGEFAWEDRNLSFGNLVKDYLARAVQEVCRISASKELTIVGYCMGGTITSMYLSLFSQPTVKNAVMLAAPFDFSNAGVASKWLQSPGYDADKITNTLQLIPGDFIDVGVKMLRPLNNYWGTYTRLWKSIDSDMPIDAWKAIDKWVNDNVNFPGEVYRQWIKDLYQQNKLITNELIIQGQKVDLSRIQSNLLVMAGDKDHLVLPHQTKALLDCVSSTDKTFYSYPVGHGGLAFGNFAKTKVYPVISAWLAERSD